MELPLNLLSGQRWNYTLSGYSDPPWFPAVFSLYTLSRYSDPPWFPLFSPCNCIRSTTKTCLSVQMAVMGSESSWFRSCCKLCSRKKIFKKHAQTDDTNMQPRNSLICLRWRRDGDFLHVCTYMDSCVHIYKTSSLQKFPNNVMTFKDSQLVYMFMALQKEVNGSSALYHHHQSSFPILSSAT